MQIRPRKKVWIDYLNELFENFPDEWKEAGMPYMDYYVKAHSEREWKFYN